LELLKFSKVLHCMCARASHVAIVCGNLISMVQLRLCFNCTNFPSYGTCEAVKCDSCTKFYLLGKYIEDPMKPKNYQIWGRGVALLKKIQELSQRKKACSWAQAHTEQRRTLTVWPGWLYRHSRGKLWTVSSA